MPSIHDQIRKTVLDGRIPVVFEFEEGLVVGHDLQPFTALISRYILPYELMAIFVEKFGTYNPGLRLPKVFFEFPFITDHEELPFGVIYDTSSARARKASKCKEFDEEWRVLICPYKIKVRYAKPSSQYLVRRMYEKERAFNDWLSSTEGNLKRILGNSLVLNVDGNQERLFNLLTSNFSLHEGTTGVETRSERFNSTELARILSHEEGAVGEATFVFVGSEEGSTALTTVTHECWNDEGPNTLGMMIQELVDDGKLADEWKGFLHTPSVSEEDESFVEDSSTIHGIVCHGISLTPDVTLPTLQSCFFGSNLNIYLITL